jgi:hypothetical protein
MRQREGVSPSGEAPQPVRILERRRLRAASTYPIARLTCAMPDGRKRVLFCKYEAKRPAHRAHRHRGGVRYEARIYEELLRRLPLSSLRSYGLWLDPTDGSTFLALEYLEAPLSVSQVGSRAVSAAAAWIGAFHASCEVPARRIPSFLLDYDLGYYCGWAERAQLFAASLRRRYPWFGRVTADFPTIAARLVQQPATVVHGEFYPKNVLHHRGGVYPVDWESAAVASGEIDLASLTEKWDEETIETCVRAYRRTRWGKEDSGNRLLLNEARLYLSLRWLGQERSWSEDAGAVAIFGDVYSSATRLGIL